MRILQVDCGPGMRGGQWQVLRLVEHLRKLGCDTDLMADRASPLFGRVPGCLPFSPLALRSKAAEYDVVHVHDARAHLWAALIRVKRLVVARRVVFPLKSSPMSRWKYSRGSVFIAISQAVARQLIAGGVGAEKIRVIPDGVQEFGWQSDYKGKGIAPATEDPAKGSDLVVAAGVPVEFSTDLESDLRHATYFVYISRQEGLGSAILMAMATGVPVVASNIGGIPEVIEHERTGLLVENRPEEIAAACRRIQSDAALRATLITNALERVRERFAMERTASETLKVYREFGG